MAAPAPVFDRVKPYFVASARLVAPVFCELVVVKVANAAASTWAYDFWPVTPKMLRKYVATSAFDRFVRLVPVVALTLKAGAFLPNRLGRLVARVFASERPLEAFPKLVISAWPFALCQKPIVAVSPWKMPCSP